jgi:hypothetical protein
MRGCRVILMMAAVAALAGGCEKPAPPSADGTVKIKGRAEDVEGKPLGRMVLRFHPQDEANKLTRLTCLTQANGSFEGQCLPGRYKVTLGMMTEVPADAKPAPGKAVPAPPPLPDAIPKAYATEAETPWEVVVPPGGKTDLVLRVK